MIHLNSLRVINFQLKKNGEHEMPEYDEEDLDDDEEEGESSEEADQDW